jgi:transcription elongation GreA/GreB family factor
MQSAAARRIITNNHRINKKTNQEMKNRKIIMSAADHAELCCVIASGAKISERACAELNGLKNELERAQIVAPEALPPNVVTMNSRAELLDLDTGERMEFTLVFASEANIEEGKISVSRRLAPRCSAAELAMSSSGLCLTACGG